MRACDEACWGREGFVRACGCSTVVLMTVVLRARAGKLSGPGIGRRAGGGEGFVRACGEACWRGVSCGSAGRRAGGRGGGEAGHVDLKQLPVTVLDTEMEGTSGRQDVK